MIGEDLEKLLIMAASVSAIGTFVLDIVIHIKSDEKKEKPRNRLRRRKRKR